MGEYWAHVLNDETGSEMVLLLNAVSTNKTDFFRENDHFTFLKNEVYPQLQKQQTIRIWSCACSSGEEAYTIAMTLLDAFDGVLGGRDAKILATDISTRMLDQAEQGRYSVNQLPLIPELLRNRYCQILPETNGEMFQVSSQLKALIRFRRLNLIQEYPLRTQFDFIMCRNVMIYFDRDNQEKLIERLSWLYQTWWLSLCGSLGKFNRSPEFLEVCTKLDLPADLIGMNPTLYLKFRGK